MCWYTKIYKNFVSFLALNQKSADNPFLKKKTKKILFLLSPINGLVCVCAQRTFQSYVCLKCTFYQNN